MQAFEYIFNVGGNFQAKIDGMTDATGAFSAKVNGAQNSLAGLQTKLAVIGLATDYVQKLSQTLTNATKGGVELNSKMHDLSAVAGVTGEGLKQIEQYARQSAKAFGTDAATAVEGYKLLLSQLSPELGKYPEALQAMGKSIQTTSKLMGNDGVAAAEVLTTAMNQYGVSLEDPMQASREMARMMNVMAAAGQAGSAELPAIKVALEQCGMAAKSANVSFEETNAAIQVLDKAGKKGSEGGVALRNTLAVLSQGRFLPKDTIQELQKAGVNVLALSDQNKTLKERLELLKPVLNDAALFGKLFGRENANAARALVQGTDALADFTAAVTGTTSAEEQAAIVMDSYAERQARIKQRFEDLKISLFQATGDFTLWTGVLMEALVPLSQLTPLIIAAGKAMLYVKNLNWAGMWQRMQGFIYASRIQLALMNRELLTGQFVSNGFVINTTRATLAVLRFSTVGLLNGIKALGSYLLSLVTAGTASATFATTASISFTAFRTAAVTACRAISVAIMNIPIIGWIAAAIAGLIALGQWLGYTSTTFKTIVATILGGPVLGLFVVLYDKCEQFRGIVYGIWEVIKSIAQAIWEQITAVAQAIWDFLQPIFEKVVGWFNSFVQFVLSIPTRIYNGIKSAWGYIRNLLASAYNWLSQSVFAPIVKFFTDLYSRYVKPVLDKIVSLMGKVFNPIIQLWNKLTGAAVATFKTGYEKGTAAFRAEQAEKNGKKGEKPKTPTQGAGLPELAAPTAGTTDPTAGTLSSGGSSSGSESKIRNITVSVDKLIENFTITTNNLRESAEQVKDVVSQALLSALNDVNLAGA